jgi:hypothetical protein
MVDRVVPHVQLLNKRIYGKKLSSHHRIESVIEQDGVKQKMHYAVKHSFCYLAQNSRKKISGVNHREGSAKPNILFPQGKKY